MASPEQVEIVASLHRTFSDRDVEGFVSHLADDAILRPSTLIAGREEYRGIEDVRVGFGEIAKLLESSGEDVLVEPLRFYVDRADEEVVVSVARVTVTRSNDSPYTTDLVYSWRMKGEKVAELGAWLDVDAGLQQLREPEEVEPAPGSSDR
jgi:ketosteroid isomerase-like protein